jgi:hypothetical protein
MVEPPQQENGGDCLIEIESGDLVALQKKRNG